MTPKLMRAIGMFMMVSPILCLCIGILHALSRLCGWAAVWWILVAAGTVCWMRIGVWLAVKADTLEARRTGKRNPARQTMSTGPK